MDYLNGKYDDPATSNLLDMGLLVDPQFNAKYILSEKTDALKHKAVVEVEALRAVVPTAPKPADQEAAGPPTAKKKSLASFFKQSTAINPILTQRQTIENELSSYLQSVGVESDTDPFKW